MAIDESIVDRIIAEALQRHGGERDPDPDVWEAQSELYDKRTYDPALAGDNNYVIAEHYMLSRALVASGQMPVEQLLAQIETYARLQAPSVRHGTNRPATADRPTNAAALALRKMAEGARDGEAQRQRNGTPKPEFNPKALAVYTGFHRILGH